MRSFSPRRALNSEPPRLERGEFGELRRRRLELLIERVGEHAPIALRSALDATILSVADPIEAGRIDHRQRFKHDRVDQGEDGGRCANTQRQSKHGGESEDG